MPTEHRTTVVVEGRTEGFQQASQEAQRLNREVERGVSKQAAEAVRAERQFGKMGRSLAALGVVSPMRKLSEEAKDYMRKVEDLEGLMQDLARTQIRLTEELGRTEKGSAAYQDLERRIQEAINAEREAERQTRRLERAYKDEAAAVRQVRQEIQQMQGSFGQGFMQGAVNAPFIQRGPGAVRQAAGIAAGRTVRGIGAAAGGAFMGIGGMAQGLAGIPIVGGFAAGQLQTAAGFAQQALGFEQQMMQAAPFLGLRAADPGAVARARARAMAGAGTRGFRDEAITTVDSAAIDAEVARRRAGGGALGAPGALGQATALGAPMGSMGAAMALRAERARQAGLPDEALRSQVRRDLMARQRQAGVAAGARAAAQVEAASPRARFLEAMRGQGEALGMTQQEMMQQLAGVAQAGGGTFADIQAQGMMGRAGAAARFGLGPEVAGAFMQAGRRGGLVGGQGRAGEAMESALANAMKLGLEGSELADYMRRTAEGIQAWRQTGIPINEQSIGRIGMGMAPFGLGGIRGGAVAQGLQQYGQRLAGQGPQGGVDIMALQTLGGVTGRGGLAEYVQGLQRLEEMDFGPEQVQKLFQAYTRAGAGGGPQTAETQAAGALTFRRAMSRMGINMGFREIQTLQAAQGGRLNPEQQDQISRALEQQRAGMGRAGAMAEGGGMVGAAERMVPAAVRRQVDIANRQLTAGRRVLTTVQNLESAATNITGVFTKLAKPLEGFSGWVEQGTKYLGAFVDKVGAVVDSLDKLSSVITTGPR